MFFQKVHVVINLSNHEDDSILDNLANRFKELSIELNYTVVYKNDNTSKIVERLLGGNDLIAVYGGDGTVTRVAQAMIGQPTPLAIIPGGTANVIAKEFGIPLSLKESIELITGDHSEIRTIDTGVCNGTPFIIRVNFGLMADMVSHTKRMMKDSFGQMAYGIAALDDLSELKPVQYKMHIDGIEVSLFGVSLSVTNMGSIGVGSFAMLPDIKIDDGLFDVILLDHADFLSLLRIAGSTLLQNESSVLRRWKCKEITIDFKKKQDFMLDDKEMKAKEIKISMLPKSLNILVPSSKIINE